MKSAILTRDERPPTKSVADRMLEFIEGPWAPAPHDLPERRTTRSHLNSLTPYRDVPADLADRKRRAARVSALNRSAYRWRLSQWSSVYEFEIPLVNLPLELYGFTILHLSDLHFLHGKPQPVVELARIAEYVESSRRKIDVVLLSGDIITRAPHDLCADALRHLRRISSVCPRAFLVLGNHDYHGHTPERVIRDMVDAGFRDITDDRVDVRVGSSTLSIYGVDDAYFGVPRPPSVESPDNVNILLTHNVDAISQIFPSDFDLILSGHTHWGEFRFLDGSQLMRMWGYCENINQHTWGWAALTTRTLSFIHPGLARYYVPYRYLRVPPGIVLHSLYGTSSLSDTNYHKRG